jgi:hypothetical protein
LEVLCLSGNEKENPGSLSPTRRPISDAIGERLRIVNEELGEAIGYVTIGRLLIMDVNPHEITVPARYAIRAKLTKLMANASVILDAVNVGPNEADNST